MKINLIIQRGLILLDSARRINCLLFESLDFARDPEPVEGLVENSRSKNNRVPQKGSVLAVVTWMLALLAIFTIAVHHYASQDLVFGQWFNDRIQLRSLANAGVQRALFEIQKDNTISFDAVNEKWGSYAEAFKNMPLGEGSVTVYCPRGDENPKDPNSGPLYGACDEASRINLNFASRDVLQNLFRRVIGAPDEKRIAQIADSIIDWRDPDDAALPDGAEEPYYRSLPTPYRPRNGPFESVEELMMVRSMDKALFDRVKPYITVYTDGKINFNTAGLIVLEALGFSPALANKIVTARWGPDAVEGTVDDLVFQDPTTILDTLAAKIPLNQSEREQISTVLGAQPIVVKSDFFRIFSTAHLVKPAKSLEHTVICVARRNGLILSWKEGSQL